MLFLWIIAVGVLVWRLYASYCHFSKVPKQVPWSHGGRFTPYLVTQIARIWNSPTAIGKAYQEYSKKGRICAMALPFSRPEILLPQTHIRWITSQSNNLLSPTPVQHEIIGIKYAFLNSSIEKDFVAYDILRVKLNRHLPKMVPKIMEELATSIDETFGSDTQWKEVQIFLLIRRVLAKLTAWLVVGDALSCDTDLVDNLTKFSSAVIPSAVALSLFPPFLQPVSSRLPSIFNRIYMGRALKVLGPHIEQEIAAVDAGMLEDIQHDNVLTWHIQEALRKKESRDGLADVIACRIFATMFAALESTTLTMTHALFNLCGSDPSQQVWKALEEEGRKVLSTKVDQASVNDLQYADSAIKETLRLHTAIKALSVQVMQPGGLTLQDYKVHLPQGSRVSVSVWGIHHDEDIYPHAYTYDAFRFVQTPQSKDGLESTLVLEDTLQLLRQSYFWRIWRCIMIWRQFMRGLSS
ncbi:hypothetical protein NM208_g3089 [Fusarium decemcellulare]|uniref:Uncharacterized protein n=1 Tax=Fusarium decemcellulare TaxID=57161 RepID=A0ACC1SQG2_9HYPO|nr:hypothetical protein NM208_g3089 [Fusarium decemcellulare]